jgi:hypothetical protein
MGGVLDTGLNRACNHTQNTRCSADLTVVVLSLADLSPCSISLVSLWDPTTVT